MGNCLTILKFIKMRFFIIFLLSFSANYLFAQSIDKIQAIVGSEILLTSDIENQYNQILSQGVIETENIKCEIVDELLFQNFLVHHAKIDSTIEVNQEDIEAEVMSPDPADDSPPSPFVNPILNDVPLRDGE